MAEQPTPDSIAFARAAVLTVLRFLRALADDDERAVAEMVAEDYWQGLPPGFVALAFRRSLHLSPDQCRTLAEEYTERIADVDAFPRADTAVVHLRLSPRRLVHIGVVAEAGRQRVVIYTNYSAQMVGRRIGAALRGERNERVTVPITMPLEDFE